MINRCTECGLQAEDQSLICPECKLLLDTKAECMDLCIKWANRAFVRRGTIALEAFKVVWKNGGPNSSELWIKRIKKWQKTPEFMKVLPPCSFTDRRN